jgi:hypothetical protein
VTQRRSRGVVENPPPPPEDFDVQSWIAAQAPKDEPAYNPKVTAILVALIILAVLVIAWPR